MANAVASPTTPDFLSVTELAGDEVSKEQVERICDRYYWAAEFCANKDVVEVACGTGQGLGYLSSKASSIVGSDVSQPMIERAKAHYGDRFPLEVFDASEMPFGDNSKDVIIIFEALYYLPDVNAFFAECNRVLRPGGRVLLTTANKDLFDFNPSPYSHEYLGVVELKNRFANFAFETRFWGGTPVGSVSWKQKVLRPAKKIAVTLGLMPKTMAGKKLLKKIVFGGLVQMPLEIDEKTSVYNKPDSISADAPNRDFKVIYCEAKLTK